MAKNKRKRMGYALSANLAVLAHFSFVVFVVLGGLLLLRWRKLALLHIPAAIWGATVEFTGWLCPLTPLENELRRLAGESGYSGGFIEHYLLPVLYPAGLTREIQTILGSVVVLLNLAIYAYVFLRKKNP